MKQVGHTRMARFLHRSFITRTDGRSLRAAVGCAVLIGGMLAASAVAETPPGHGTPLPGTVGPWRPPSPVYPYFQPVEFHGPLGVGVSVASQGTFSEPQSVPALVGLLVHPVYRLRLTGIPEYEGRELFPTVELLDRLCAPPGQALKFPIPIELTAEDLRLALEGHFVTRVIYVEDPRTALPVVGDAEHPNWYDAGPGTDPVAEAKQFGRPIAILRMGGILPDDRNGPDIQFLNGCPPFALLPCPSKPIQAPSATRPPAGPTKKPVPAQERAKPQTEPAREPAL